MKKLLIVHQGALGDMVLTFPAIIRLRKAFGRIDLLCQSQLGKAARALGIADNAFPLESALFSSLWSDAPAPKAKQILGAYDEILLFSFSEQLEQAVGRITGGTPCRISPRPDVGEAIHVAEHILAGLETRGLLDGNQDPAIPVHGGRPRAEHDPANILIHPGSGSGRKNWPFRNFIEAERLFMADGMRPEFVIGPAEDFLESLLKEGRDRIVHRISDLTEMIALFENAGGFVGNDSGLTHLAAFTGLPTVAVFGPSDPRRWRPVEKSVAVLAFPVSDCHPCFETGGKNCGNPECLKRTSPEMLIRAFRSLMIGA